MNSPFCSLQFSHTFGADEALRNSESDAHERVHGVSIATVESHVKDERRFKCDAAADWIVISALRSAKRPGFVGLCRDDRR